MIDTIRFSDYTMVTLFLPVFLEIYNALSADETKVDECLPSSGQVATPQLIVTCKSSTSVLATF
jgi:hypothetical protein